MAGSYDGIPRPTRRLVPSHLGHPAISWAGPAGSREGNDAKAPLLGRAISREAEPRTIDLPDINSTCRPLRLVWREVDVRQKPDRESGRRKGGGDSNCPPLGIVRLGWAGINGNVMARQVVLTEDGQ